MIPPTTASENQFSGLFRVLDNVIGHRQDHLRHTSEFIESLSTEWHGIRQEEIEKNFRENHHFNPLRRIKIRETHHSRILGDLLNPSGSHGQNTLFLDSFLHLLEIKSGVGKWTVSVEANGVDILLRREDPASVVIIENKVHGALDQEGQLYRYWFCEIYSNQPDLQYDDAQTRSRFRVVYLPPRGYSRPVEPSLLRPPGPQYTSCLHGRLPEEILDCRSFQTDVAGWLKGMAGQNLSNRLTIFLNLYSEIWSL